MNSVFMKRQGIMVMLNATVAVALGLATSFAQAAHVFHLDFSTTADVSGNNLPTTFGAGVTLVPGGGPLAAGSAQNSGIWAGGDTTSLVTITDNATLDGVATGAGSIVTWIKVDDQADFNSITETSGFGEFNGIELQSNSNDRGVFGATSGWSDAGGSGGNVFGPGYPGNGARTPSGVWTHIAMTWDTAGESRVYVNGIEDRG